MKNGGAGGRRVQEGEEEGEISSEVCMLVSRFSTLSMGIPHLVTTLS